MFAGAKIPTKSRARTLIEMSYSLRTLDLDFSSGTFSTSGWMTLEWQDPRCRDRRGLVLASKPTNVNLTMIGQGTVGTRLCTMTLYQCRCLFPKSGLLR